MGRVPIPSELRDAAGWYWLLDLTWGGRVFHFADRDVESVTAADPGVVARYVDALVVENVTDSMALFELAPTYRSVAVQLFGLPDLNVALRSGQGLDGTDATGIVRLWADTGTTAGVTVWTIRGRVREMAYGAPGEPIEFTLRETWAEDTGRIPGPTARVDATTWPNRDSARDGVYYPWVIGQPGSVGPRGATPGLVVDTTALAGRLLIAGHHCAATTVTIRDVSASVSMGGMAVVNTVDGLGNQVALVNRSGGPPAMEFTAGTEYWVAWDAGGGMIGPDGATALRGLGDVVRHFLRLTASLAVDWARLIPWAAGANHLKIDGYLQATDERLRPSDWLRSVVLPLAPASVRWSDVGTYLVPWRYEATADDAVARLVAQAPGTGGRLPGAAGLTRISGAKWSPYDEVANEWLFRFRRSFSDSYLTQILLTGHDATLREDTTAIRDWYCATSEALYGWRARDMTSDVVWDAATAAAVVGWLKRRWGLPTRTVSYVGGPWFGALSPGDVVAMTDADIGWTEKVCMVDAVGLGSSKEVRLDLRTIENPPSEALVL